MPKPPVDVTITCEECRRPWLGDERGWQAHRVDLDEVALYCPECADGVGEVEERLVVARYQASSHSGGGQLM
jgi:hypothetical protein